MDAPETKIRMSLKYNISPRNAHYIAQYYGIWDEMNDTDSGLEFLWLEPTDDFK